MAAESHIRSLMVGISDPRIADARMFEIRPGYVHGLLHAYLLTCVYHVLLPSKEHTSA